MKIVVAGGAGRIGMHVVHALVDHGHEVVIAAPSHGVDAITGRGLEEAFAGAQVVVDTVNLPSTTPYDQAFQFFQTTATNLVKAGQRAGVGHYVLLSIVGADRVNSEYFRGKLAQEHLLRAHNFPHTVVRSTTFFEACKAAIAAEPEATSVRVPDLEIQPVAGSDVARVLAHTISAEPEGGLVEVAGPERMFFSQVAGKFLRATGDARDVHSDSTVPYLGTRFEAGATALLPDLHLGRTTLDTWLDPVRATQS